MTTTFARIILKKGKEKSLHRFHPWIFSGAIASVRGQPQAGETVKIYSEDGKYLATAAFSPHSQIRARIWSFRDAEHIDQAFFQQRIAQAFQYRQQSNIQQANIQQANNAYRLIHGENDGLPGLICDRYDNVLVIQCLSAGIECHKATIIETLQQITGCQQIYERSDADVRKLEGLAATQGWVSGDQHHATQIPIHENGIQYLVDIATGHKTGFYLDQRDNRALLTQLAHGQMLNCFCYTGGFSLAALKNPAVTRILSIDSSAPALKQAAQHVELNQLDNTRAQWLDADVFNQLRLLHAEGQRFDTIVLDPPKLAPTSSHVEQAARAYKDLNIWGMKLLNPNGLLFTYSCSSGINNELFQKIVAGAAADAKVNLHIEKRLSAGIDHPINIHFPEGEYLKGLLLRKY